MGFNQSFLRGGIVFAGVIALLAAVSSSNLYASTYQVDNTQSKVFFKVRKMASDMAGEFTRFRGQLELDPEIHLPSQIAATIEVSSVDTEEGETTDSFVRRKLLKGDKFPEITFKSKRIENGKVIGDLTMRGVTKEVAFDFVFHGLSNDPAGQPRAAFSATTRLDRKDFDMKFSRLFDRGGAFLSNTILMTIQFQAFLIN
ncbi:MAG TPA: YceI family protein [bacterium]|nr:YceI family protein [bacterium]